MAALVCCLGIPTSLHAMPAGLCAWSPPRFLPLTALPGCALLASCCVTCRLLGCFRGYPGVLCLALWPHSPCPCAACMPLCASCLLRWMWRLSRSCLAPGVSPFPYGATLPWPAPPTPTALTFLLLISSQLGSAPWAACCPLSGLFWVLPASQLTPGMCVAPCWAAPMRLPSGMSPASVWSSCCLLYRLLGLLLRGRLRLGLLASLRPPPLQ